MPRVCQVDALNTTVRVGATLTSLSDLDFCLGGIAILALDVSDPLSPPSRDAKDTSTTTPPVLHASTGGPADHGADWAFQPWVCPLALGSPACDALGGTPYHDLEPASRRILSMDSGCDGRSSNFMLPIVSVEFGGSNASTARGIWTAPEYR